MLDRVEWESVSDKCKDFFLNMISSVNDKFHLVKETTNIKKGSLPFYNTYKLIEVDAPELFKNKSSLWFLMNEHTFHHLDGSSSPIHDVNEEEAVLLTEENVGEYLQFFSFFVHGTEGPFIIIEHAHHPVFDKERMSKGMIEQLEEFCKPVKYEGKLEEETYKLAAIVLYGNALFNVNFVVTKTGMVEIADDNPIMADLPVRKIKPNY